MTNETDLGAGEFLDANGMRWWREFDAKTGKWQEVQVEAEGGSEAAPHDEAANKH
jgi:hypothetical protein